MRITFDVDGVLADNRDESIPYAERLPYPGVAERLKAMVDAGLVVIIQTARYMRKCDGDQDAAHAAGYRELETWLAKWSIPYHELYFGKASSDLFVDDRGFSLRSNNGGADWDRLNTLLAGVSRERNEPNEPDAPLSMTKQGAD